MTIKNPDRILRVFVILMYVVLGGYVVATLVGLPALLQALPDLMQTGQTYTEMFGDVVDPAFFFGVPDFIITHIKTVLWVMTGLIFLNFILFGFWVYKTHQGLKTRQAWARRSAVIMSWLSIPSTMLPFGLFGLWLFSRPEIKALFNGPVAGGPPPTGPAASGEIFIGK